MTDKHYFGAILADGMGLGKTLQAVATIWTFLKQGPQGLPLARKGFYLFYLYFVINFVINSI